MSKTKNALLFYIVTAPLGYFILQHIHHVLLPFNLLQRDACQNPTELLATYSAPGFHDLLDRVVCVTVRFCFKAINDPLCLPLTTVLVGFATTAYVVMSVERARFNNTRFLAPFMITMGNIIGTGIIAPLAWLPLYGWSLHAHYKKTAEKKRQSTKTAAYVSDRKNRSLRQRIYQYHHSVELPAVMPHDVFGIAAACLLGQFLPVALVISEGPSFAQRNILAAFQYFGFVFGLIACILPFFVKRFFSGTRESGKESVKLLYAGVAGINAFIWFWSWLHWFRITESPELMIRQWIELFFAYESGMNPVAHMLLWDIAGLFGTFAYWSWLEDGRKGVQSLVLYSVLGPGAGLALYALKREHRI